MAETWNEYTPMDREYQGAGKSPLPRKYQITKECGGVADRLYPAETKETVDPADAVKVELAPVKR